MLLCPGVTPRGVHGLGAHRGTHRAGSPTEVRRSSCQLRLLLGRPLGALGQTRASVFKINPLREARARGLLSPTPTRAQVAGAVGRSPPQQQQQT